MFEGKYFRKGRSCTWNDKSVFDVITPQWPWELLSLVQLFRDMHPRVAVEIGTYYGGTLQYWLKNAPAGGMGIALDPEPHHELENPPDVVFEMLKMYSYDKGAIAKVREYAPIDFLFIDADHSYKAVKYDFETYGPMVAKGGIIALHDICTQSSGVPQLWREIREAGYLVQELYAAHSLREGGIGVVHV